MIFVFYLLITFLIGCLAMLICLLCEEDIKIFFNPKAWDVDNNGEIHSMCIIAMFFGYVFMFGFAFCYWLYKLCTIGRR